MPLMTALVCFTVRQREANRIEHGAKMLSNVFRQESQDEIAVLLQEHVFAAVAAIGLGIVEMLRAVQFDDETSVVA